MFRYSCQNKNLKGSKQYGGEREITDLFLATAGREIFICMYLPTSPP